MDILHTLIDSEKYDYKCYDLLKELINTNPEFKNKITAILTTNQNLITGFTPDIWEKIANQNFISPIKEMHDFSDMFILGYNIGNCGGAARQLSYSFNNVDIITGILPLLKGSKNAEKEGGHYWLETDTKIIDTSLMLIIDKSLKEYLGYQEELRLSASRLAKDPIYQSRKEFVNDKNLKRR